MDEENVVHIHNEIYPAIYPIIIASSANSEIIDVANYINTIFRLTVLGKWKNHA